MCVVTAVKRIVMTCHSAPLLLNITHACLRHNYTLFHLITAVLCFSTGFIPDTHKIYSVIHTLPYKSYDAYDSTTDLPITTNRNPGPQATHSLTDFPMWSSSLRCFRTPTRNIWTLKQAYDRNGTTTISTHLDSHAVWKLSFNPLTPELNSLRATLPDEIFIGDFASWTVHFVNICVKNQQIHQLFIQFIDYVW
jgi:hypothetical protein